MALWYIWKKNPVIERGQYLTSDDEGFRACKLETKDGKTKLIITSQIIILDSSELRKAICPVGGGIPPEIRDRLRNK